MNNYTIEYYSEALQDWISDLPVGIRAAYARLAELLSEFGIDLRLPHARAMGKGLYELRPQAKEGIARVFYCVLINKRIVIVHAFIKKTQKTPARELATALKRMKEVKNDK